MSAIGATALALFFLISTSAVVKVTDLVAVKCWLSQHSIDLVVDETTPSSRSITGRHLRGVLLQMSLEV
jgi:hypothetical protein